MTMFTSYGDRRRNKITDFFFMILAWLCRLNSKLNYKFIIGSVTISYSVTPLAD